jgi:phosphatidylglycerophosphatase A
MKEVSLHRVWQDPWHFIAFGFGLGTAKVAPGTFGTLAGVLIYLLMQDLSLISYLVWVLVFCVFGIWVCDKASRDLKVHDHPGIVWDEVCGYLLTMVAVPNNWLAIIIGFFAFRLFDIWKPWPIKLIDKHVEGGLGIMLDDIIAAVPAALVTYWLCAL